MSGLKELGYKTAGLSGRRPTIELLGGVELAGWLIALGDEVNDEIEAISIEAARPLVREIKANAPRESGDMADSIDIYKLKPRGNLTTVVAIGPAKDYYYWLWNEMGAEPHTIPHKKATTFIGALKRFFKGDIQHPGVKAKPFIRPAYDRHEEKILSDITNGLNRLIEKFKGRGDGGD